MVIMSYTPNQVIFGLKGIGRYVPPDYASTGEKADRNLERALRPLREPDGFLLRRERRAEWAFEVG